MTGVQTCALRSEEHTSELQSHDNLVCRLLLEKKQHHRELSLEPGRAPQPALRPRAPARHPALRRRGEAPTAGWGRVSVHLTRHCFFKERSPSEIHPPSRPSALRI